MQSGERLMSATVSGSSLVDRKRVDHDAAYHQCVFVPPQLELEKAFFR